MSFEKGPQYPNPHQDFGAPPPGYAATPLPSSGFRIALDSKVQPISKQDLERAGPAPFADLDNSPIYLGSALFMRDDGVTPKSVQPCKIGPHLHNNCSVAYGGGEVSHHGRYDLLLFDHTTMEWVQTSHGHIPEGRTPIEGGYEENVHDKLYHAAARVNNILIPGKTGRHLGAAHVSFGGGEHTVQENYEILCWKIAHKY